jgi:hypothetical protein
MQTNHVVKKWQKINSRSVYTEHNKLHKVTIKQSHKQFASMNKKTAQLKTAIKKGLSGRLFFAIRIRFLKRQKAV